MTKTILSFLLWTAFIFSGCGNKSSQGEINERFTQTQKDLCDDPDADISCCFKNAPTNLTSTMTIAKQNESGENLKISGTIFKSDGISPYPNIILYAYHTDSKGYYSKDGNETGFQKWHGRLHGWCKTDNNGHYEILTIRPGRYPDNSMPAHIHAAIKKDSGEMYYISDFVFKDDSLVNEKYLSSINIIGGNGVVDLKRDIENNWVGIRDIIIDK